MKRSNMIRPQDRWPASAVGFILLVSVLWWGFALLRLPGAPVWLDRARTVCFNLTETGLPDTKGWMLLLGQPPTMLLALYVGWRDELGATASHLGSHPWGRALMGFVLLVGLSVLTAATLRVRDARLPEPMLADDDTPDTYPRLDRSWPEIAGLVDQSGAAFTIEALRGSPAFVTFAFGHCVTVCPMLVHAARQARTESGKDLPIVVLTLDPWRDTPARLPALVDQFQLDADSDFLVGGEVEAVEAALDAWMIPRERDETTGDVTHPALVYLVDADGTVAYASSGGVRQLVALAGRLR